MLWLANCQHVVAARRALLPHALRVTLFCFLVLGLPIALAVLSCGDVDTNENDATADSGASGTQGKGAGFSFPLFGICSRC